MKIAFSDFDGTLTTNNKLSPIFFEVLSECEKKNLELVIVSGRSVSWGHFLLTHFPIESAIMEGGGVILLKDNQGKIREDLLLKEDELFSLDEATVKLLQLFPGCPLSADSFGRKTDRAIEFKGQDKKMILDILSFFENEGIHYTQSDVHINFWVGNQNKYKGIETFLVRYRKGITEDECLFFGDSLNDESVFKEMKNTIGVSNIEVEKFSNPPKIILKGEENIGPKGVLNYLKNN